MSVPLQVDTLDSCEMHKHNVNNDPLALLSNRSGASKEESTPKAIRDYR